MGKITMDLRLVFKIPGSGLRINGLIQGLKESSAQIRFSQVVDRQKGRNFMPLAEALSIPANEHNLEEAL